MAMANNNLHQNQRVELIPLVNEDEIPQRQPDGNALQEILPNECEISEELSADVFQNDMLREIILEYVLFPKGVVSRTDLKNLRLVRKHWLKTTADSMRKSREPVFTVRLDNDSTNLLEQFVRYMKSPVRLTDSIPPFSLKLNPPFFCTENQRIFSDMLTSCGDDLVSLDLTFSVNDTKNFALPSFHFPKLQRLAVQFYRQRTDQLASVEQNAVTICHLQTLLNAADELKELTFNYNLCESLNFGFDKVALPKTIKKLCLNCEVTETQLQFLIRNDLPQLTSLRLFFADVPYPGETVFEILDKFRTSLRSFELAGFSKNCCDRIRDTTLMKFPIMGKLEKLTVDSKFWELEDGLNHLENQLPKLSAVKLLNLNDRMFTKWTRDSKFDGVQTLAVSLDFRLTQEEVQNFHCAFPNVVNLDITPFGLTSRELKYFFNQVRSLEQLTIRVLEDRFHPYHWDYIFIGGRSHILKSLRENQNLWNFIDLKDDKFFDSIRNLTALKSLTLINKTPTLRGTNKPFITDLSFLFGFFKMPNLKNLSLGGRFQTSEEMAERWELEKGVEIRVISEL